MKIINYLLIKIIEVYRILISPIFANSCRFEPSCSQYCIDCLKTYGLIYAILMTAAVIVGFVPLLGFFIGLGNVILFILYWIQLMDVKKALPQL